MKHEKNAAISQRTKQQKSVDIIKKWNYQTNTVKCIITVNNEMKVNTFETNWKTYLLNKYKLNNNPNGNFITKI